MQKFAKTFANFCKLAVPILKQYVNAKEHNKQWAGHFMLSSQYAR